jgi:hypothetical protein
MKTIKELLAGLLLTAPHLLGSTIGFDDIDANAGDVVLASLSPYSGFSWTNFSVYTVIPGFPGFNNGIVSGPNGAYTSGDALGTQTLSTITATSAFDLVSANLGSGWYDGLTILVEGLFKDTHEFSKTITVSTSGAQLFAFNFTDIDEVQISSIVTSATTDPYGCGASGCSELTLDNIVLTSAAGPPPSIMPEPATLGLATLSLLALAAALRFVSSRRSTHAFCSRRNCGT